MSRHLVDDRGEVDGVEQKEAAGQEGASGAARAPREIKPVTILSLDYREIKKIWLERHPDMTFATLGDLMDVKVAEGDEDLLVRTACGMDKVSAEHLRSPSLPPPPPPLPGTGA